MKLSCFSFSNKVQNLKNMFVYNIIFVNIHLLQKRKRHICLRFGKLLKLARKLGRSLPENIYDPIFQYRSIHKAKIWFDIDIDIIIRCQN